MTLGPGARRVADRRRGAAETTAASAEARSAAAPAAAVRHRRTAEVLDTPAEDAPAATATGAALRASCSAASAADSSAGGVRDGSSRPQQRRVRRDERDSQWLAEAASSASAARPYPMDEGAALRDAWASPAPLMCLGRSVLRFSIGYSVERRGRREARASLLAEEPQPPPAPPVPATESGVRTAARRRAPVGRLRQPELVLQRAARRSLVTDRG